MSIRKSPSRRVAAAFDFKKKSFFFATYVAFLLPSLPPNGLYALQHRVILAQHRRRRRLRLRDAGQQGIHLFLQKAGSLLRRPHVTVDIARQLL